MIKMKKWSDIDEEIRYIIYLISFFYLLLSGMIVITMLNSPGMAILYCIVMCGLAIVFVIFYNLFQDDD
jgi:hypothetical protein